MSAKKDRTAGLTTLELQAQNIAREDDEDDVEVTDEAKYAALLESRKNRRAGECLYDFLERQVKDQMRTALGQPLQNISTSVLNKMVSRDVQANLRKYKMAAGTGRTPSRGRRSASRGPEDQLSPGSPTVHFEDTVPGRSHGPQDQIIASRAIRQALKDLDTGFGEKLSLLKMLITKCDENDQNYNRLRNCIVSGEMETADRIICDLQASNGSSLADIQNEVSDGADLMQVIGNLTQLIQRDLQRARSAGRVLRESMEVNVVDAGRTDKSHSPLRSALKNNSVRRDLSESFSRTGGGQNERLEQLQRQLMEAQTQIERLQHDNNAMVLNYNRKMEAQEDTIRSLNQRLEHQSNLNQSDPDYEGLLRRENETLKREVQLLKERAAERVPTAVADTAEAECSRLRQQLSEKERELLSTADQMRQLLQEKESLVSKQKNEWAEIYGNMKRETDGLKRDVRMLNKENERLVKQIETTRGAAPARPGAAGGADSEVQKRLKKRELECQALWETLRDMYNSSQGVYDTRQMLDVLAVRALDVKAKKKLNIGGGSGTAGRR